MITGADGRFSFQADTALPAVATINVDGSDWHSPLLREFGNRPSSDAPALVAGENAVGDLVLETGGALAGRLLSARQEPIARASVTVSNDAAVGSGRSAYTDRDGRFTVIRIPPGKFGLDVSVNKIERHVLADVRVARSETTQLGDIVLPDLKQIRGIVVDEAGAPIARVKLSGSFHARSSQILATETASDGTFAFELAQSEPFAIDPPMVEGFEAWRADASARMFDPGTHDVRIVLAHAVSTTFFVLDAATQAPIETFGIRVSHVPEDGEDWAPIQVPRLAMQPHEGGTVTLSATPGSFKVLVAATGHAPFEDVVRHDPGAPGHQTIALRAASRLLGRVVIHDAAIGMPKAVLQREWLSRDPTDLRPGRHRDVEPYAGREQTVHPHSDGTFAFDDLAPGTYDLRFESPALTRTTIDDVHVAPEGTTDLGDIELQRGATARVRVLTTEPQSPKDISLWLDRDPDHMTRVESADGAIDFDRLAPGSHALQWSVNDGFEPLERDPKVERFSLVAGETREIVLDLRTPPPCVVTLHVTRNGKVASGIVLSAYSENGQHDLARGFEGLSDEHGTFVGSVTGGSTCDLRAWSGKKCALGGIDDVPMPAGGRVERTIDVHTGTLVIELPAGIDLPDNGAVSLFLKGGPDDYVSLRALTPHATPLNHAGLVWNGRTVDCGEIAAGDFDAVVHVFRYEPDDADQGRLNSIAMRPALDTKVRIEEGREARIVVP